MLLHPLCCHMYRRDKNCTTLRRCNSVQHGMVRTSSQPRCSCGIPRGISCTPHPHLPGPLRWHIYHKSTHHNFQSPGNNVRRDTFRMRCVVSAGTNSYRTLRGTTYTPSRLRCRWCTCLLYKVLPSRRRDKTTRDDTARTPSRRPRSCESPRGMRHIRPPPSNSYTSRLRTAKSHAWCD